MIKKRLLNIFVLLFFLIIVFSDFSYAVNAEETSYHTLFQRELELFPFSSIYENESFDGFNTYNQAIENASDYPFTSYKLLLECYRVILIHELAKEVERYGEEKAVETFIINTEKDLFNIMLQVNNYIPLTFASLEWIDLAKREIRNANEYLNQSKEYFNKNNMNTSFLVYLIGSNSSIHKAKGFFLLSNEKNEGNTTLMETSDLLDNLESVSSEWIGIVEATIDFYEDIGLKEFVLPSKDVLNLIKSYHSNGLYYVSIMNSAYAKALIEYNTQGHLLCNNYSQALTSCETYLNYVDLTMNMVYNNPDVDAPFAVSLIEQAKLHFQDAKKVESEENSVIIAGISIQESLIAREQAKAALELKNAIEQELSKDNQPKKGDNGDSVPGFELIILVAALLITVITLRKNMLGKKKFEKES